MLPKYPESFAPHNAECETVEILNRMWASVERHGYGAAALCGRMNGLSKGFITRVMTVKEPGRLWLETVPISPKETRMLVFHDVESRLWIGAQV